MVYVSVYSPDANEIELDSVPSQKLLRLHDELPVAHDSHKHRFKTRVFACMGEAKHMRVDAVEFQEQNSQIFRFSTHFNAKKLLDGHSVGERMRYGAKPANSRYHVTDGVVFEVRRTSFFDAAMHKADVGIDADYLLVFALELKTNGF